MKNSKKMVLHALMQMYSELCHERLSTNESLETQITILNYRMHVMEMWIVKVNNMSQIEFEAMVNEALEHRQVFRDQQLSLSKV